MQRMAALTLILTLLTAGIPVQAAKLAIVIDDLGHHAMPEALSQLPHAVSVSILPNTPFDIATAEQAHREQRDVLLHMPMQPQGHAPLEPLTLTFAMSQQQTQQTLRHALLRIPYVVAINNHMGSALTQNRQHMDWVMTVLNDYGVGFLDSRTSAASVAEQRSLAMGLPTLRRHVFLDHVASEAFVARQLKAAVKRAQRQGYAIAIGHPYPVTLTTLAKQLPLLEQDIELVPLSTLF